jgi:hypothetical protein
MQSGWHAGSTRRLWRCEERPEQNVTLPFRERQQQGLHDLLAELFLNGEQVLQRRIQCLRPEHSSAGCLDQLTRQAQAVAHAHQRARENRVHAGVGGDLP